MSKITDKLGGAMRSSLGVGTPAAAEAQAPAPVGSNLYVGTRALSDARAVPVERIVPDPEQPRHDFEPEKLAELGLSMKRRGQLQPIRVREDKENDRFVIVAGERRWRAAKMMEIATLDCLIVKRPMTDGEKLTLQLIENCVREDLKPIEQGQAFRTLMDREGWTAEQLSKELNLSPADRRPGAGVAEPARAGPGTGRDRQPAAVHRGGAAEHRQPGEAGRCRHQDRARGEEPRPGPGRDPRACPSPASAGDAGGL